MKTPDEKIPRTLHYCWFGRGPKPGLVRKCMRSWKRHAGEYRLVEWNEDNFDIRINAYVKQAYEAGKYAFVSDYARLYALYHHGGLYLDTDVELLKNPGDLHGHAVITGFEDDTFLQSAFMGATKHHPWIKGLLDYYEEREFIRPDGTWDMTTNTSIMTERCRAEGLRPDGTYQELAGGVVVYPSVYFSPYDYKNCGSCITQESYAVHHFAKSWLPVGVRIRGRLKKAAAGFLGPGSIVKLRRFLTEKGTG